jgi:hypothetical protein
MPVQLYERLAAAGVVELVLLVLVLVVVVELFHQFRLLEF